MKKNLLFMPLFAALAFTGCTKEDSTEAGGNNFDGEPRYLAVSIATTPSLGESTRADNRVDENGTYTQSNGSYEDGLAAENEVKTVRFYFFTETGATLSVRNDGKNYYDYTPKVEGGRDPGETVSKSLEAVVVVNAKEQLPSSMIAIVNPTEDMNRSMSRTDLLSSMQDNTKHENGFMMSNSVYINRANEHIDAVDVSPAYYCTSEAAAKKNPIHIYVERCVAKVRVQLGAALEPKSEPVTDDKGTEHNLVALKYLDDNKQEQPLMIGEGAAQQQVYVELLGWGVDGVRDNSYAIKHLLDEWKDNEGPDGMDAAWNLSSLHRCFWAVNTPADGNTYYNYTELKNIPFSGANYTYCNENARRSTKTKATSVVIPARLCNKDGESLMICEYAGVRFVDDADCSQMKKQVLFRLQNSETHFWTKVTTDGTATWREINENDIEFSTVYDDNLDPDVRGRYYVKAQMTAAAGKLKWYKSSPEGGVTPEEWAPAAINTAFSDLNRIKIWKDGMTYYALFIPHLGSAGSNSAYGVVRNHVYAITIDNVYGLGTPVYNPAQKIMPEKVKTDDVYVSAKVELLSWRLVSNNVTLDWGK